MAEEKEVIPQGYKENPDLLPVPAEQRRKGYGSLTFILMMFSMNTCIPMFFLGPLGRIFGMDIYQTIAGALIGNLAAVIVMYLNGVPGVKYGIPYPVQLRESWGWKGIHLPVILRGAAGTVWFGIEAYAGSFAVMMLVLWAIAGFPTSLASFSDISITSAQWIVIALIFYCASFVVVMRGGLKSIGKMADWAGPLMLLYFIWLIYFISTASGITVYPQFITGDNPAVLTIAERWPLIFVSTAGWFSIPFFAYLGIQTNWWATVALNISDLSRGINPKKPQALFWGLFIGVVVCQVVGTVLGYIPGVLTGLYYPQQLILLYAPGIIPVIIGLLFAFLAPWSTDITANAPPLIDILMTEVKMRWKSAVVVSAVIAFLIAPWWLNYIYAAGGMPWDVIAGLTKQGGTPYFQLINDWSANYGILLGPLAGIMIGNFWITRKKNYDVQRLYTRGPPGPWYSGGYSKAAFLSFLITWIFGYVFAYFANQMYWVGYTTAELIKVNVFPLPGGISWYPAVVISFIFYVLLARQFKE